MRYSVHLSELAEEQYDNILAYIANQLNNSQALRNVMDDFDNTIERLETMADTYGYCKSERLKAMELHSIGFLKHRYLLVYRIIDNKVIGSSFDYTDNPAVKRLHPVGEQVEDDIHICHHNGCCCYCMNGQLPKVVC